MENKILSIVKKAVNAHAIGITDNIMEEIAADIFLAMQPLLKVKRSRPVSSDAFQDCKHYFMDYCTRNGYECYFTGTHARHLKQLIQKLAHSYEKYNEVVPTNEQVLEGFTLLMNNLPKWIMDKKYFSIMVINSRYDNIATHIKHLDEKTPENKTKKAFDKIDDMLNKKEGDKRPVNQ